MRKKNSIRPVSQLQTFNMINLEKSPVTPHLFIKNHRLSEIKGALHTTKINYSNDQMIMQKNVGDADETEIYTLSGDHLLRKSFMMMSGDQNAEDNSFTEDKLEKDCVKYYIDGKIWTSNCSSDPRVFPSLTPTFLFRMVKFCSKKSTKFSKKAINFMKNILQITRMEKMKNSNWTPLTI